MTFSKLWEIIRQSTCSRIQSGVPPFLHPGSLTLLPLVTITKGI